MKKILLALALVCLVAAPAFAAGNEAAVEKAVEGMRMAMLSGKKADLEKIPMKSLTYVHSGGAVDDYKIWLDKIVDGKVDTYKKVEFNKQVVMVDGDVAIVRHIFDGTVVSKGVNNDQPYDVHLGVMQIWRKAGGTWKLFARQAFKLPTP